MGDNLRGQVVKIVSNDYFVYYNNSTLICKARGKFRNNNTTIKVGDYVLFDDAKKIIFEVLDRKNELERPRVSNIDIAFIITSFANPSFSSNLLDKLISICEINNIKPVICFTKKDLISRSLYKKLKPVIKYYKKLGYSVVFNNNLFRIKRMFKNKTVVFTGQSGAGKSTLINRLDSSLNFETNEISHALGRGKHTTRYVTLVNIGGGKVLDTPGFSSIDLSVYSDDLIRNSFVEFSNYSCPYKGCMHINEKECLIKREVGHSILSSRYDNYVKFIRKR